MSNSSLTDAFTHQAKACASLGSPFMEQLCNLLADRLEPGTPLTDRLFGWPGDLSPAGESVPLRLAGALHALVLSDRGNLADAYPPNQVDDDTLWAAVSGALETEADFINTWINSPPQTNEVRRSAVLIAVGQYLAASFSKPFVLSEMGASAGLNLNWEHYALVAGENTYSPKNASLTLTPEWSGPLPPVCHPYVVARQGVDLNPIEAKAPEGQLRLLAYLWPDQPERLELTRAAIDTHSVVKVVKGDAIDWLEKRLTPKNEHLHMIYTTIAWQYFPDEAKSTGRAMIEAAGENATADAPIAWFTMENDGQGKGAALNVRIWPGNVHMTLGRACFHGRWVDWKPERIAPPA